MCNQYSPADPYLVALHFKVDPPTEPYRPGIGPWGRGPFVRNVASCREAVVEQWALIGDNAREARSLARIMTTTRGPSPLPRSPPTEVRGPRGQRCLTPAESFLEPNLESGENQWWRFRRSDGAPLGLAWLWNRWTDRGTGEIVDSYTMLTVNADADALMSRMHRPDPKLPPDQQDKRSVVVIEPADFDVWLGGSNDDARTMVRLAPQEVYLAGRDR